MVVGQNKDKITESLDFIIKEQKTCKNIFIDKNTYRKFKNITQKTDDRLSQKELKGLGELIGENMTKSIYVVLETKSNLIFGIFNSKEKTKEVLGEIIQSYKNKNKVYEIPKEENECLILI